ncbi:hypothetical protein F4553_006532 [Allocatelliglobosispora scoriae]|uniref:Uncharacterized protein n=1 Tax=Allocatelliglobosispora scoriae TaxID=643052 RepID=A0A841C029_9ACTN|nr:hypothetical protein [Allocatelliglobosispora scoriae]MBB5873098.1 hypothetical protein [Allocatelliglobosispora scoriae]
MTVAEVDFGTHAARAVLMLLLLGITVSAMAMTIQALRRGNRGGGRV